MSESLRTVEKAMLLQLVYPTTTATLPLIPDLKKSPRLQVLDTGMLNYFEGLQKDILETKDLQNVYKGTMIEHLVGQEILTFQYRAWSSLAFWVRDKKDSSAELDYLYLFDSKLIPIEVKSGADGRLKSLHLYLPRPLHPQINHPYPPNHYQQPRYIFRLRSFHAEDRNIWIGTNLFYKEPLDPIEQHIGKE